MVLTNFELWAADGVTNGSNLPLDFVESSQLHHNRHLNPFDPRAVTQLNSNSNHLSSNGYYGFSYINSVHDNDNNNNNNNNNTSNINHNNNNNNSTTYNFMANDVNGMNNTQQLLQQTHASSVNFGSSAYAAGHAAPVARCKKRFFVMNDDDDAAAAAANNAANCTATNKNYHNYEVSAKRCRFDDDFSAQYCNDFFQLPSTQIATQSCLMDTEEGFENNNNNNNNNIEKYEQTLNPQLQTLTAHQQQLQHQQISQQQQQQQPQQQHLYHQQQHYQGHLHRANRDVSRCMLSHMI
ncbi:uncharacterized protein DDB_G0283357 isoform X2 [Lucilia sericata]|uniref:uncharacterized protein DDB_G0283357 isoform X2 n=1 Tax=Lucilia sericata TaxID=13632 RepID=UPI0018A835C4|nr:uncharacterized protein DDB_G0283357 isoform X2 [Lucilia sericata]